MRQRAADAAMRRLARRQQVVEAGVAVPDGPQESAEERAREMERQRRQAEAAALLRRAQNEEQEERRLLESPVPRVDTPESQATDDGVVWLMDEGALAEYGEPAECSVACPPPRPPSAEGQVEERRLVVAMEVELVAHGDARRAALDEDWDSDEGRRDYRWRPVEVPMFRSQEPAREAANAPLPRQSRGARRRARRYNPNRQMEIGDYVSVRASPPSSEEAGPPSGRPRHREERRALEPPPARDVEPRNVQPGHSEKDCPRPKVRVYCRNCGRHGEDLKSCPRCGPAHAQFLRRNFVGERVREQELDRQRREAVRIEQMRAEEIRRRQYLAEQEWRDRAVAHAQAQAAVIPPTHAQLQANQRAP